MTFASAVAEAFSFLCKLLFKKPQMSKKSAKNVDSSFQKFYNKFYQRLIQTR